MNPLRPLAVVALAAATLAAQNQPGHVARGHAIVQGQAGFVGPLADHTYFGTSVAVVGDVDGDGIDDLAVGAWGGSFGGFNTGGVWILFMNADGSVDHEQALNNDAGDLPMLLDAGDQFGESLAAAGDLDGDGVPDLWVGARGDDDGLPEHPFAGPGAVYGLRLRADGTVKSASKISMATTPALSLAFNDSFGSSVAVVGDLDGDGVDDLVVGAPKDKLVANDSGAVWVLLMKPTWAVASATRYAADAGPLVPTLGSPARFGTSVCALGDLDGNGSPDFAVGAPADNMVAGFESSVWVYLTKPGGGLLDLLRISAADPLLVGLGLEGAHGFGDALALIGDVDGDGDDDLAVGANNGGTVATGAVWILHLGDPAGTLVEAATLIDDDDGYLPFALSGYSYLGTSLAARGDIDGDGAPDLVAGLSGDDTGGLFAGGLALLSLRGPTIRDLGHGLAGNSSPLMTGSGTLVAGDPYEVRVSQGPQFGLAWLALGLTPLGAPFKGGVMVPEVDLLISGLGFGVTRQFAFTGTWPAGIPAGFETYLQCWTPDAGAPKNWAASNGLRLLAGE